MGIIQKRQGGIFWVWVDGVSGGKCQILTPAPRPSSPSWVSHIFPDSRNPMETTGALLGIRGHISHNASDLQLLLRCFEHRPYILGDGLNEHDVIALLIRSESGQCPYGR